MTEQPSFASLGISAVRDSALAKQDEVYTSALANLLFQLADDDLVLGHRDSEWLGVAPDIEGDVAFSSIAQDEVGHASLFYRLLEELGAGQADGLAFYREAQDRKCALLVERENRDWAYSLVRHYVYDVFEDIRLRAILNSSYLPLAHAAAKIVREEYYHLLHGETMLKYLAKGGQVAHERVQAGVDEVWKDLQSLLNFGTCEKELTEFGIITASSSELQMRFDARVRGYLESIGLVVPPVTTSMNDVRRGVSHTDALDLLLRVMSEVADLDRSAKW